MTIVAIIACILAGALAFLAWTQHRDAAERSAARVAALAAAIDGPIDEPSEFGNGAFRPFSLDPHPAGSASATVAPAHRWMIAAGIVPAALVVGALMVTRAPKPAPPAPAAHQPESVELLAMHHARAGDVLTVTGTVRVRGRDAVPVTAVVTGRDTAGRVVASGHAPLDDAALDAAGESSFQVAVPRSHDVSRYQVRFETSLGPLTHVDRRLDRPGPSTP
jgi:hypothetical protein